MPIDYWQSMEEGSIFHIYNHAVGNRNLFDQESHYNKFLHGLLKYFGHVFDVYAYCLMPNHFHILAKIKPEQEISSSIKVISSNAELKYLEGKITLNKYCDDQFRRWFSGYSLFFNKQKNSNGQLFQKRIKKVSIDEEKKLLYLICYIHHNSIHHGFEKEFGDWKYCSYSNYLSGINSFNNGKLLINCFGDFEEYLKVHSTFQINYENDLNLD